MSGRPRDWPWSTRKRPAPEHGIRIKKAGTTWWGMRWIEALEQVLRGDAGRLARGKTYARAGRTHDLSVQDGKVTASVTGSRSEPYQVTVALKQLDDAAWTAAIAHMAAKAQFTAELLGGQMPRDIDEAFAAVSLSLFPKQRSDLRTSCSCPDWGDPCKHVAATHYVLGEALDRDPFLLFELRGRTKQQVLAALRSARGGQPEAEHEPQPSAAREVASVVLKDLNAADYDKLDQPLPHLEFRFEESAGQSAVLRQLGAPAAWRDEAQPADVLAPLVRAAAENARRLALSEPAPAEDKEPPAQARPARRRAKRSGKPP